MPSVRSSSSTALFTSALLVLLYAIFPIYFSNPSPLNGTEITNGSPHDTPVKVTREASSGPPIYQIGYAVAFLGRKLLYGTWSSLALVPHLVVTSANMIKLMLSPVLYLLHPAFLLIQYSVRLLVVAPVQLLLACLSLLYPIYVFGSIACVCGILVALCGRLVGDVLLGLILGPSNTYSSTTRSLEKR